MFENTSQGMFFTSILVYRALPALKILASILMSISVYRHAKSNKINRKGMWTLVAFGFPVLGRLAYCVYHRFIRKKNNEYLFEQSTTNNRKGAITCILSLMLSAVAGVISIVSIATMGASVIKSVVDDEYLFEYTCYDVHGNKYSDIYDVPLYDREGNTYTVDSKLTFSASDYIDQNGNRFEGNCCYLDSDGFFVYNETDLIPCKEYLCDYYYDDQGSKYFYLTGCPIYWDENGDIFASRYKATVQLFDETEECLYG